MDTSAGQGTGAEAVVGSGRAVGGEVQVPGRRRLGHEVGRLGVVSTLGRG